MSKALKEHIKPIERRRWRTPEPWKRSAVRLYFRTNAQIAAYVFNVHHAQILRWRDTIRL